MEKFEKWKIFEKFGTPTKSLNRKPKPDFAPWTHVTQSCLCRPISSRSATRQRPNFQTRNRARLAPGRECLRANRTLSTFCALSSNMPPFFDALFFSPPAECGDFGVLVFLLASYHCDKPSLGSVKTSEYLGLSKMFYPRPLSCLTMWQNDLEKGLVSNHSSSSCAKLRLPTWRPST